MSVFPHATRAGFAAPGARSFSDGAPSVLLAASPGGHLDLLRSARSAFAGAKCVWLTSPGPVVANLRETADAVEIVPLIGRSPKRVMQNTARSLRAIRRHRPQLIVTSGASPAIPVASLGRALGIPVVFVETMARVTGPSASGRVLSRLAQDVAVQWPEMAEVYPGAHVCRPALLEDVPEHVQHDGHGTMVALGTHGEGFDRLLRVADEAAGKGLLPRPIHAQVGHTEYEPKHFDEVKAWLPPAELRREVESAEVLVCHAGAGIISGGLRAGLRPVVMPRLASHGEHIDDHQLQITEQLGDIGAVVPIGDSIEAPDVAAATDDSDVQVPGDDLPTVAEVLRKQVIEHTEVAA